MDFLFILSETRFVLSKNEIWKNKKRGSHAEFLVLPVALRSVLYEAKTLRGRRGFESRLALNMKKDSSIEGSFFIFKY